MAALSEPEVLAATKSELYPDAGEDTDTAYVVTDTQFAKSDWLNDTPISDTVKQTLSPFNRIQVGSGYPDIVALGPPPTLLDSPQHSETTPVVVVEAKGETAAGRDVDVSTGIVQAHDRLAGANAAVVTAPEPSISSENRSLARELNVGLLSVTSRSDVRVLENPRFVGLGTTRPAAHDSLTLRASYSAIGTKAFPFNSPKNYLTYPVCVAAEQDTETAYTENVVNDTRYGCRGAAALGLVTTDQHGHDRLTMLGRDLVRFVHREYNSLEDALRTFDDWHGMHGAFVENEPAWRDITELIVARHPMMQRIINTVERRQTTRLAKPVLPEVVTAMYEQHPADALEIFIRADGDYRAEVLTDVDELDETALYDAEVYSGQLILQIKHLLHHAGILTTGGNKRGQLVPSQDKWALQNPLSGIDTT